MGRAGPVPMIRLFGVDEGGRSVCVNVFGFTPYLYADPPSPEFDNTHCGAYRMALEAQIAATKRGSKEIKTHVLLVTVVRRQSILGYAPSARNMVQIMLAAPQLVATARTVLERGFRCPGFPERCFQTYESNVPFELRYMVDNNIVGCNWLELPPKVCFFLRFCFLMCSEITPISRSSFATDVCACRQTSDSLSGRIQCRL